MQFTLTERELAMVTDALQSQHERFLESGVAAEREAAYHYKHLAMALGEAAVRERRRLLKEPVARHGAGGTVS